MYVQFDKQRARAPADGEQFLEDGHFLAQHLEVTSSQGCHVSDFISAELAKFFTVAALCPSDTVYYHK